MSWCVFLSLQIWNSPEANLILGTAGNWNSPGANAILGTAGKIVQPIGPFRKKNMPWTFQLKQNANKQVA